MSDVHQAPGDGGDVTYTLSRPITVIGSVVSEVTLREPTGEDLVKAGSTSNQVAYSQRLIEITGNLPTGACKSMRARDVMALGRITAAFLGTETPEPS